MLVFGSNKIPELARGIGKAEVEYKKAKQLAEDTTPPLKVQAKKTPSAIKAKTSAKAPVKKTTSNKKTAQKKSAEKTKK